MAPSELNLFLSLDNFTTEMFQGQLNDLQARLSRHNAEKKTLRKLDIFVLDNSLRETSIGTFRGHTLENKWSIYNEVSSIYLVIFQFPCRIIVFGYLYFIPRYPI